MSSDPTGKFTIPKKTINDNYRYNGQFNFNDYIFGQGTSPARSLRMGYYYASYNGCGWIATYNVLRWMRKTVHPKDIIRSFERRGALVYGKYGVEPFAVHRYLQAKLGYFNVALWAFPSFKQAEKLIKTSSISILLYRHGSGAHYVALLRTNNYLAAFNEREDDKNITRRRHKTILELIGSKGFIMALITID